MARWVSLYILVLLSVHGPAQNLVPNPSFEEYISCPKQLNYEGLIEIAPPWFRPTGGTSDFFHECPGGGVPNNFAGNQYPRAGKGYAGLVSYWTINIEAREYISAMLLTSMVAEMKYCVAFYHSKGDKSSKGSDGMGVFFSIENPTMDTTSTIPLPFRPQIENPPGNILLNDSQWIKLQGIYIAEGGEQYITIGNFLSNDSTQVVYTSGSLGVAYYYIDDISVIPIYDADAGMNKTLCPGSSISIGTVQPDSAQYAWLPGTGLSDSANCCPVATPDSTVTYTLTKYGMCDTTYSQVTVLVQECPPPDTALFIPNTITPNGDGANDTWVINGLENYPGHWIKIFNRNGNLLWQTGNYDNTWDGTVDGTELPAGVYFYILYISIDKDAARNGALSIIR